MYGIGPLYLMMILPAMLLAMVASLVTHTTFKKYSRVRAWSGLSGAQAAERMLRQNGVFDVKIERADGFLSDHYDPTKKALRLSPDVFDGCSLSAIGVACHEAGHALQHAQAYAPLQLRTALVPLAQIGSSLAYWVFFAGLMFHATLLMKVGVALFGAAFLFSVVTLPVEWDASARAKAQMAGSGLVGPDQLAGAGAVLNAAFLTYLAGAVTALMTLLYYLLRSGLLGGSRDRD